MNFALFALVIAAAFFVCSLVLLNFGRHLGMRYLQRAKRCRQHGGTHNGRGRRIRLDRTAAGIHDFRRPATVRRARRQLVIQEANAVSTAYSWMKNETFFVPVRARWHEPWKDKNGDEIHHESNFALTVRIPSRRRQRQAERHVTVPLTNATFGFVPQQRTPIP